MILEANYTPKTANGANQKNFFLFCYIIMEADNWSEDTVR